MFRTGIEKKLAEIFSGLTSRRGLESWWDPRIHHRKRNRLTNSFFQAFCRVQQASKNSGTGHRKGHQPAVRGVFSFRTVILLSLNLLTGIFSVNRSSAALPSISRPTFSAKSEVFSSLDNIWQGFRAMRVAIPRAFKLAFTMGKKLFSTTKSRKCESVFRHLSASTSWTVSPGTTA